MAGDEVEGEAGTEIYGCVFKSKGKFACADGLSESPIANWHSTHDK